MKSPWLSVTLSEVATIEKAVVQPEEIKPGTLYLGLEHVDSGGARLSPVSVGAGELASSKFAFTCHHLLYGKLRPYLAKIACPDFNGICSTDILPILPGPNIDRRFLLYFLRQPTMVEYASSRAIGANLPRLSPSALSEFIVPLPPLLEQRRIAKVLDLAEALRSKRRLVLTQTDTLTQSLFLDLFGDLITNTKGWPCCQLQEAVKRETIVTYGIVQAGDEFAFGVPYIRTGDIAGGEISQVGLRHTDPKIASKFGRSRVEVGDIVMSIRATVGTTALVPPELNGANLTQGTARIAPREDIDNIYLLNFLRSSGTQHWISQQIKGATFREITLARLRELPIILPPLGLQQEFARRVAVVEKMKSVQKDSLLKLDELFNTLQHRAFRGEL